MLSGLESGRNPAHKPDFWPGSTIAYHRVQYVPDVMRCRYFVRLFLLAFGKRNKAHASPTVHGTLKILHRLFTQLYLRPRPSRIRPKPRLLKENGRQSGPSLGTSRRRGGKNK